MKFLWRPTCHMAISLLIAVLFNVSTAKERAPVHQVLTEPPTDMMLSYFRSLAERLPPERPLPETKEQWERRRVELRRRLWQSLGDFPLDERPPLRPRITGQLDHGDHVVEKVVYESLPGLYVTALVYVPKNLQSPAPAVICVNGH